MRSVRKVRQLSVRQPDPGMAKAIEFIRAARQPDSTWLQGVRHPSRAFKSMHWLAKRRSGSLYLEHEYCNGGTRRTTLRHQSADPITRHVTEHRAIQLRSRSSRHRRLRGRRSYCGIIAASTKNQQSVIGALRRRCVRKDLSHPHSVRAREYRMNSKVHIIEGAMRCSIGRPS